VGEDARWISVGELAAAFSADSYLQPFTNDLAGSTHFLQFEDGRSVEHRFLSDSRLAWTATGGEADGSAGEASYFALKARDGIYLVDFVAHETPPTTVSLLLDLGRGIATSLVARLPDTPDVGHSLAGRIAAGLELTAVTADFASAAVDTPFIATTPRHEVTPDLIGRRVEYTYSPTERYEHIYLNENYYTWHCLLGSEKGLADTDRCHYLKLADQLYFFVWREKIVPTLGAVVVDFAAMRTMGKIFGHAQAGQLQAGHAQAGHARASGSRVVDFPVGARARFLNLTLHTEGAP
jgi:MoaF C-terminal domain/MoaF N-terminal domain